MTSNNGGTAVLAINRGVERAHPARSAPASIHRLEAFIGSWLTEGHTVAEVGQAQRILASDVYEWGPGRCCVIHHVREIIGDTKIGAIEIIGPGDDEDSFVSYLHDCFDHVATSSLNDLDGDWLWQGAATRCFGEVDDEGNMHAHHKRREADGSWAPSMEVLIRRVAYSGVNCA